MIRRLLMIFVLLVNCGLARAEGDARIRDEVYDRHKVFTIYARIGKESTIQMQPGETIDVDKTDLSIVGLGFGEAWKLGFRANTFVFKPSYAFPDTNMTIVTNKRTYLFDLKLARKKEIPTTYLLSFSYPEDERKAEADRVANLNLVAAQAAAAQAERDRITAAARAEKVAINTHYSWRGDNPLLKPTAAWDDGRFTHLEYNHAGELPVFYKVLPDGTEAQINMNINTDARDETVLQEVTRVIRARLGNDVIEIVNDNYKLPEFNNTGSSVHGAVRVERNNGGRNVQ